MNDDDIIKAKQISTSAIFKSDYPYDEHSVNYGAEEMAKYKNEQFKELIRKKAESCIIVDWHDVSFDAEKFIKEYLNL